jgi:hypothetical protein
MTLEKERQRSTDDEAATHNYRMPAIGWNGIGFQETENALGSAWNKPAGPFLGKESKIVGMKAIHILGRVNGGKGGPLKFPGRERGLDQDSVYFSVGIPPGQLFQNRLFRDLLGEYFHDGSDA